MVHPCLPANRWNETSGFPVKIVLAFCLHKFCPCGIPAKSANCASIKEEWRAHTAAEQHVCWDWVWWASIRQEDQVQKQTAVENLLECRHLTNWEFKNTSVQCPFLEHLRFSKVMEGYQIFPSPFFLIFIKNSLRNSLTSQKSSFYIKKALWKELKKSYENGAEGYRKYLMICNTKAY